jgi:hypothetical protein
MRWASHVAGIGEKREAYRLLVGKPEVKRPLGRPRRRWVEWDPLSLVSKTEELLGRKSSGSGSRDPSH